MKTHPLQSQDKEQTDNDSVVTALACPECAGPLWINEEAVTRLYCRIGHAYSLESFLQEQEHTIERELWTVIRILRERAVLQEYLSRHAENEKDAAREECLKNAAGRNKQRAAETEALLMRFLADAE